MGRLRPILRPAFAAHLQQQGGAAGVSYALSTLTAASATGVGDGTTTNTLTLTARDTDNVLMAGRAVTWVVESGVVSVAQSTVAISPADIASNGIASSTITVIAMNAAGVPLPNIAAARVVIAVTGTGNTITQPSAATDKNGATTGSVVSTQSSATKTVSATIDGTAITDTETLTTDAGVTAFFSDGFETGDFSYTANDTAWQTPDGKDAVAGTGANGSFARTTGTWTGDYTGIALYLQSVAGNANGDAGLMGPYTVTSQNTTTLFFTGNATGAVQKRTHRAFVTNAFARGASTYSVKLVYGPDPEETDSRSEPGFDLPLPGLGELWLEYYLYVPANYVHRAQSGGIDNNKFAGIFGRDRTVDTSRMLFDFETRANATGGSNMFAQSVYSTGATSSGAQGVTGDAGFLGADYIGEVGSAVTLAAWNRFRIHVKSETAAAAADGVMQLWVDNTKVYEATGRRFGYPSASGSAWYGTFPALVDSGYLLGASNSGYTELTVFYLDDVKFYSANPSWTF